VSAVALDSFVVPGARLRGGIGTGRVGSGLRKAETVPTREQLAPFCSGARLGCSRRSVPRTLLSRVAGDGRQPADCPPCQ
jgi:hypothetical protein